MLKFVWKVLLVVVMGVWMVWACKPKKDEGNPTLQKNELDRKALLVNMADEIIMPGYANFELKLDSMIEKSEIFTQNPSESSLAELRTAWASAYIEWQKVELIDVGPANEQTLRFYFNIYPTHTDIIEEKIASGTTDLNTPGKFILGFPALDYLINGMGDDLQTVDKYTSAPDAAKRIAYLKLVTGKMKEMFSLVHNSWKNGYRDQFVGNTSINASSPFYILVNGYVLNYERYIRTGKFGIPAGVFSSTPEPNKVEAFYKKDLSLILAQTAYQASIDFFNGKSVVTGIEGASFKTYLAELNAKIEGTDHVLVDKITAQFASAKAKMDLLKPSIYEEVTTNNQAVLDVFDEIQTLVPLLKVDMTKAMNVTISYVDTDGD